MTIDFTKKTVIFTYILLLAVAFLAVRYIFENTIKSDEIVAAGLKGKFSETFIQKQLDGRHRPVKSYYFTQPLVLLIKLSFISLILLFGAFIVNIKGLSFWKLFCTAALAEVVVLGSEMLKMIWFLYFQTDYTLLEVVHFSPLSIISIMDIQHLDFWQSFLFSNTGIFPLLYMFFLSWLINKLYKIEFSMTTQMVLYSVGISYVLYLIGGTLIYMNF